jgi:sugar phosphate isomerase/epimerase
MKSVSEGTTGFSSNLSKEDMDRATGYVKKMALICKEAGSKFIVVLVPLYSTAQESDRFRAIEDYVIHDFESSKIAFRDWAKVPPENNKGSLIYKFDRHWNYEGHAFFSTFLTKIIRENMTTNP